MKKLITIICLSFTILNSLHSQINEVGISIGGSNYIGDLGRETYIYPNDFAFGVIFKHNINSRIALRGTLSYLNIQDDDADSNNIVRQNRGYSFSNEIKELGLGIDFNFFDYEHSSNHHYFTPYIIFEAVVFNYSVADRQTGTNEYEYKNKTSFALPIGLGYKARLSGSLGISFEVKARYTFNDDLDYNNPEIEALNFGNPNSNDWYMFSGISLVYTFGRESCDIP